MLTLHTTEFHYDYRDELYTQIAQHLQQGTRAFLIVPEQQTLLVEKEASKRLPPNASLRFEVTNFSRMANTAFRTVGGLSEVYSTATAKALIMWQALTEAAPVLHRRTRKDIGTADVTQALAALSDMQGLGIDADALASATQSEALNVSSRLKEKMHDLSIIAATFRRLHNERFADVGEDVEALARTLKQHRDLFADAVIYIDGFTSFTEPQLHVIEQLLTRCHLTVYLTLSKARSEGFEYTETRRTADRLLHLADRASVPKRRLYSVGNTRTKDEGLYEISRVLWQANADVDYNSLQNTPIHLRIFESDTPFDAAEFLASYIQRCIQNGAHYSDFAIVMRHAEQYRGIVDTALAEAGIPFFMSEKRDVTAFEAVKLIDTAFRIILGGYKREDILAYAKCGLSGIASEACDEFELYAERWRITGSHFTRDEIWNMNPDGYTDRWRDGSEEALHRIDTTRRTLLSPLLDLAERQTQSRSVKEQARALMKFMIDLHLEETLLARSAELRRMGEQTLAEENEHLFSVLTDALQQMVDIMGELPTDARAFHALLMIAFSSVSIGRIPSYTDCITIGSADMLRLSDKPHVVLFGVHDGEFPASQSEGAWFTEQEKRTLFDLGLTPEQTDHVGTARELFAFSRAFTAASDTVTLFVCRRGASFKPLRRAGVIERVIRASHGRIPIVDTATLAPRDSIYTPAHALSGLSNPLIGRETAEALRAALDTTPLARQTRLGQMSVLNDELSLADTAGLLYGGDIALTQSRLEMFLSCPLRHFLTYVLKLDDNSRASFNAMNIGTFVHAILENFFREAGEGGTDLKQMTAEDCRAAVARIAGDYIRRVSSDTMQNTVRLKHFLHRLTKTATVVTEGIVEELRESGYQPRFFELPIENRRSDTPQPIVCHTSDGHGVYVYGTIDRVDTFVDGDNVYVRVVDYKTGNKPFSPKDLKEGQNLQMFLYLRSVVESEHFRPALGAGEDSTVLPGGVLYVGTQLTAPPLSDPTRRAEDALKAAQTRRGMLLDDPRSIAAMNPKFLPIKYKKDGTPDSHSVDRLYTHEGWQALCDIVSDRVTHVAERMKTGEIPADPIKKKQQKSTCEYCAYKPICRNAQL